MHKVDRVNRQHNNGNIIEVSGEDIPQVMSTASCHYSKYHQVYNHWRRY